LDFGEGLGALTVQQIGMVGLEHSFVAARLALFHKEENGVLQTLCILGLMLHE
jgi:hypothetical protein